MAADPLPKLEHKLLDIPDDKFVEVVRLLERVRDHPDVRQTFAIIRPRLAQVRPDRRPTLKRVMCMPFEDLLESFSGIDMPLGRIERRVIGPVWRLIEDSTDRALFERFDRQVQGTAPGDRNALVNIGCRLWPLAARILRNALADEAALLLRLNGDAGLLRQVGDIAAFLELGPIVEALKGDLSPKPLAEVEGRHLAAIEQAVQAAARQATGLVYHTLLVAASRLATPADLLTVLHDLDLGKARREQPALFAQISGLVVSNLEERTARLDGQEQGASVGTSAIATPEAAIAIAERLIASVNTTNAVMDLLREPVYRGRLDAVKAAVGAMVSDSILKTAPDGILSAVPAPVPGGRPLVDETSQIAAEDHARALRRCAALADTLGLQQSVNDTLKAMSNGLIVRAQALLDDYPRLAGKPDDAEAAGLNLFYALRLLEMVAGPTKADQLRVAILAATGELE